MILSFDFWVTTGSSTPIIPIKKGDVFYGKIENIGIVNIKIV
jgi:2-keto-4-pentenoate hydratase